MQQRVRAIKKQGYIFTLWSIDSKDWREPGVNRIVSNVVQKVFPRAIVLLHDGGGFKSQIVLALEPLIDKLIADGYRFVTLSELRTLKDITSGT